MDWEKDGGAILREGYLLKTAGGQKARGGGGGARETSAKIRYFRLVEHQALDPPTFVLYYHDTPKSKTQKGHFCIDHDCVVKLGWLDAEEAAAAKAKAAQKAAAKRRSGSSRVDSVGAGGQQLPARSSSSGSLAAAFGAKRSASGMVVQAIASNHSRRTAMRLVSKERTLFLMSPPQQEGDDSSEDASEWIDAFNEVRAAARDAIIMRPTNVQTLAKVEFDAASQSFGGVPDSIAQDFVKAAFNLPLTQTTFVHVPGYGATGIPLMLVLLREFLFKLNGHKEPGIFRIAPEKHECEKAKRAACLRNREDLEYILSPHVFSTLIKQWLRDLPGGLLNQLGNQCISSASENGFPADPETEIFAKLDPIRRAIFKWLLDTLSMPVRNADVTKMDSKNIAICVAPNLWETDDAQDPMAALVLSQQLCKFMTNCLEWRMVHSDVDVVAEADAVARSPPSASQLPAVPKGAVGGPPLGLAPPPVLGHSSKDASGARPGAWL